MFFSLTLGIDKILIKIYYDKDVVRSFSAKILLM